MKRATRSAALAAAALLLAMTAAWAQALPPDPLGEVNRRLAQAGRQEPNWRLTFFPGAFVARPQAVGVWDSNNRQGFFAVALVFPDLVIDITDLYDEGTATITFVTIRPGIFVLRIPGNKGETQRAIIEVK